MQQDVQNRLEMLDSIIRSLKGYPNFGGEVGVMKEVERLRRDAKIEALEWVCNIESMRNGLSERDLPGALASYCRMIGIIRQEIVRLRAEKA